MTENFSISVRADIKGIQKKLDALAFKQMPFATATALTTDLVKMVQAAEGEHQEGI